MTKRPKKSNPSDSILARGGGDATAAGVGFQAKMGAWLASHLLAERPLDAILMGRRLQSLRFETEAPVDDILVETKVGWIFIQAKTSLSLSITSRSDLAKTVDQFVRQWLACSTGDGGSGWNRPLQPGRDRLLLALGPRASRNLSVNLAQGLSALQKSESAQLSKAKSAAVHKFYGLIERTLNNVTGRPATAADTSAIANLITILTFDFEGADRQTATEILLRVLDSPAQASTTFFTIAQYCQEMMQQRTGFNMSILRSALLSMGVPLAAPPSYRSDIERLKTYSGHIRKHLREYESIIVAGDKIRVERECTDIVVEAARFGSLLLVGEPGAGKSAVINASAAKLIDEGHDVIVLAVDRLSVNSLPNLAAEIGLSHPLRDVLRNWLGKQPAFLFIDALDATRGGENQAVFRTLIADLLSFESCQWNVIASIRSFDLRMGEQFKHLFSGSPPNMKFSETAFPGVVHIQVPPWTDDEFTGLLKSAPILAKAIETGDGRLRELAQVPFNTRLMADLISGGLTPTDFGEIKSQVQLLELYWNHRVVKHGTGAELCIEAAVKQMIESRVLRARKLDAARPDSSAFDALLHENVLVPLKQEQFVAFRHHILFDYAVSRVYLRADELTQAADLMRHGDALGLMLALALAFTLQQLWIDPEDGHRPFWDAIARFSGDPACDPVARSVAARTASELPRLQSDAIDLLAGLSMEGEPKTLSVTAFSHVVGALVVRFEDKQSVPFDPWCELAEQASKYLSETAWTLRTLLYALYERISSDTHRMQLGRVARKLLDFSLGPSISSTHMTVSAIEFVATTYASDVDASCKLLRRLFESEHFQDHADQEIPWLTRRLKPISEADPDFVAEIYSRAFAETISDDSVTSFSQSQILRLSSNRRQDYESALWSLKRFFPSFLKEHPLYAVRALIGAIAGFIRRKHPIRQDAHVWTIPIPTGKVRLQEDHSYVLAWDINHGHGDNAYGLIKAFINHLEAVEAQIARAMVKEIIERNELGVLWSCTLMASSKRADIVGDLLWPIATQEPFLTSLDTQKDSIDFLAARYPFEDKDMREKFERSAMSFRFEMSRKPDKARQDFLTTLFSRVGKQYLATKEAHAFVSDEEPQRSRSRNRRPVSFGAGFGSDDKWRWLTLDGVDVKAPEVAKILYEIDHIKKALELEEREKEIDEIDSAIDLLNALVELTASGAQTLPESVVTYAYGIAAQGLAKLSHLPVERLCTQDQTLSSMIAIVIRLADIPAKPVSAETEKIFESSSSWGSPNVFVETAEAVMNLCRVNEKVVESLRPTMEMLIVAPDPAARQQFAIRLTALWNSARTFMWTLADQVALRETNRGVLKFFANYFLGRTIHADPERVEGLAFTLYERDFNREEEPTKSLNKEIGSIFALLWITHGRDKPWRILQTWIADPHTFEAELSQAIAISRGTLVLKYQKKTAEDSEITQRSHKFCSLAVNTMAYGLERYLDEVQQRTARQQSLTDTEKEHGTLYANILDHLCDEIYYGMGAFQSSEGDASPLKTDEAKRDFLSDMKPMLTRIADVGTPATIHHLIELLDYLVPADPIEVFNLIAHALLNAGRLHGYQFESMGADRFVEIVGHYLADYRDLFSDKQHQQKLTACLDIFLEAGWPAARRLLYRLPELLQ